MDSKKDASKGAEADPHAADKLTSVKSIEIRHKWIIKSSGSELKYHREMFTSSFASPLCESMVWKLQFFVDTVHGINKAFQDFVSLSVILKSDRYPVNAALKLYAIDSNGLMHKIHSSSHAFHDRVVDVSNFISKENLKKYLVRDALTTVCDINFVPPGRDVASRRRPLAAKSSVDNCQRDFLLMMLKPDDEYKDVVFVTRDNQEFQAHKCILSARSVVFDELFKDYTAKSAVWIRLDCESDVALEMLRFVYTGEVKRLDTLARQLLALAENYELRDLAKMCEASVYESIAYENAIDTLKLADKLELEDLKSRVLRYVAKNLKHVINTDGYKQLERANSPLIAEILRSTV